MNRIAENGPRCAPNPLSDAVFGFCVMNQTQVYPPVSTHQLDIIVSQPNTEMTIFVHEDNKASLLGLLLGVQLSTKNMEAWLNVHIDAYKRKFLLFVIVCNCPQLFANSLEIFAIRLQLSFRILMCAYFHVLI
jgi:hypothetical protein